MSLPAVSKHLKVLERAGLITRSRDGADGGPAGSRRPRSRSVDDWLEEYRRLWEERLDRLDDYLQSSASEGEETWPQKIASTSKQTRARSSARACSTRRASWCSRPSPIPSTWRNGGGRTASPPRRIAFEFRPAASGASSCTGRTAATIRTASPIDEIVPPERIVYHHGGGDDVEPVQFTQTVTFEDLGNGKPRLTWHGKFPSAEERARVIKEYGADKGLVQTMARLADYVATHSPAEARINVCEPGSSGQRAQALRADRPGRRAESAARFRHGPAVHSGNALASSARPAAVIVRRRLRLSSLSTETFTSPRRSRGLRRR